MGDNFYRDAEILIAEDDPTNYALLKELIECFGVKYLWAKNGKEAIDLLAKHKNISLVLMDINMPEMDGITATRKIRETEVNTPVVFQTAYASEENKEECFNAGGNDFISKPLNIEILSSILKKYLIKS